jgi:iron complex outermembrane receptor protein
MFSASTFATPGLPDLTRRRIARKAAPRHLARMPLAAALLVVCADASLAQTTEPAANRVVITGNPLGSDALAQPSNVLTGEALTLRRAGTLGDTLSGLVGISATSFGPQASRPVIRGLDGDRIRLLDNGGASADASNLSFDHAVAVDPLVVERIEVLRGPAALLYGGNATGGVVNTLDNRIPRTMLGAVGGRAELRLGGAAQERAGAVLIEGGQGGTSGLNWHVDANQRLSEDQRTPRFSPRADGQALPEANRVANSAGNSRAAALGGSWADRQGFLGLAYDDYHNDYGVTVEPDVTIRMQRQRAQLAGERRGLAGPFSELSFQASQTRYSHAEVEGDGVIGTTFTSRGSELRLQAKQDALAVAGGQLGGVIGLQVEQLDFSALGSEAFVPNTLTRSTGLFTLQELALGGVTLSAGARLERSQVRSDGDAPSAAAPHFGSAQSREFSPRSFSLGVVAPLGGWAPGWQGTATLGSTQRAPAYYELFADGVHVATGVYERGDPQQQLERSRHAELGLQWKQGSDSLRAAVFSTRFGNYIALDASGRQIAVDNGAGGTTELPEYRFNGVPAQLVGLEIEARRRLMTAPWQLDATAGFDRVRGDNLASGQPLPRIAPMRLQLGLEAAQGAWRAGVQGKIVARQDRVPANDIATAGATLVDLWASWQQRLTGADALWYVKLTNLGNALAYNASSLRTARELSPAGARALAAGVRVSF